MGDYPQASPERSEVGAARNPFRAKVLKPSAAVIFDNMLEMLGVALAILLAAHKGKPRRKYRRYLRGAIDLKVDVGTLAAQTLAAQVNGDTVDEKTWLSSIVATWSIGDVTPTAGVGPLVVGIAHSDYTAAEIEAFIENADSWQEGDKIAQEVARRKIKIVGKFPRIGATANAVTVLNDGKPIHTKCNWMLTSGQTFDLWIYNQGDVAYATTDPDVSIVGHANLWPA